MGDKYAVGRIRVGAGSPRAYRINAPLLTPSSPTYKGPSTTNFSAAQPVQPTTGPGFVQPTTVAVTIPAA